MTVKLTGLTPRQAALAADLGATVTATTATFPQADPDDAAAEAWEAYRKSFDWPFTGPDATARSLHALYRKLERLAGKAPGR